MRIPGQTRRSGIPFNLTPMIDVVFLLVIFFLVATYYISSEPAQAVQLPPSLTSDEDQSTSQRMTVTVGQNGSLFVGTEELTLRQLELRLREELATADRETFELRLRADERATYQAISPLLLIGARLGIRQVKFATRREFAQPDDARNGNTSR